MYVDVEELQRLNRERLLNLMRDPASGLLLADYSARAQFDNAWDQHPLLLECRGLILAPDGSVVAKPFRKFFNLGERPGTQPDMMTGLGQPEVTHKLDGSMGTLFYSEPENSYRIATRGSFTSAQAQHATELWMARHQEAQVDPTLTYVFEIIYPTNRIVVDYQDRDELVLIGVVQTETGQELPYKVVHEEATRLGLPCVDLERTEDWTNLAALDRRNFEGFVLFWPDQQVRIKIKLEDYQRLHRLISGVNEHTVWEMLRDGTRLEELQSIVSEEIRAWIDEVASDLTGRFTELQDEVLGLLEQLHSRGLDPQDRTQRRELAGLVQSLSPRALIPVIFLALDGKAYGPLLWKQIEPMGMGKAPAIDIGG